MTATSNAKNLVLASMLLAIGIVMPNVFHFAGPTSGQIFLPLYWAVGLSGLILPLKFGLMVAVLLPILSHLNSGMPAIPLLYFMLIELMFYVFFTNTLSKKINPYISISISLVCCRIIYIALVFVSAEFLGLSAPYSGFIILISTILKSIPGIIAQIMILPTLQKVYQKTLF